MWHALLMGGHHCIGISKRFPRRPMHCRAARSEADWVTGYLVIMFGPAGDPDLRLQSGFVSASILPPLAGPCLLRPDPLILARAMFVVKRAGFVRIFDPIVPTCPGPSLRLETCHPGRVGPVLVHPPGQG